MFINSIFLPKTISDQTMPEGISGKIGNFSHLFSNVFRIVNDEQESNLPFQLVSLDSTSVETSPNELLKVSLLSDNQQTNENTDISMVVKAFLSKLNPKVNGKEFLDSNKFKVNEKIPQYFSVNKNEFIKEIKNIIETLKNGDTKSLENVEISLIANGQSININPLTTNLVKLENWANKQLQSNSDFEILVKSGQKKLAVDVESYKNETSKTDRSVQIVSVSSDKNIEAETKPIVDKNATEPAAVLKNIIEFESATQQPLICSKQTFVSLVDQSVKQDIATTQELVNPGLKINSQILSDKNIVTNESVTIELKVPGKIGPGLLTNLSFEENSGINEIMKSGFALSGKDVTQNISSTKSDVKKEFITGIKNEIVSNTETLPEKKNILSDSASLNQKKANTEKQINALSKTEGNGLKFKPDVLKSDEILKHPDILKQTSEVNLKVINKSGNKITVKPSQNISSVFINKNIVQEKIAVNDLIGKTDVKEIILNTQKFVKSNSINALKIQNEHQIEITSGKDNNSKVQTPVLNTEVKKVLSTNQEVKQTTIKKNFSGIAEEKPLTIKTELNTKIIDTAKVQNTPKIKGQQGLFTVDELVEKEKSVLLKIESAKASSNSQQAVKENPEIKLVEKIKIENKNLEQVKTSFVDSSKSKAETSVKETSSKSLTIEVKTEQKPVAVKSNYQFTEDETSETKNNNAVKEVVKENVKESIKEPVFLKTNTGNIKKESGKTELNLFNSSETVSKNLKERSIVETLRTSLKDIVKNEIKPDDMTQNHFENKNVKVDLMQRRVYSQIPPLEVMAEANGIKSPKNSEQNINVNKNENIQSIDDTLKSTSNAA